MLLLAAVTLALGSVAGHAWLWISVAIAYGFLARVACGPTFSPLGRLATQVIAPRLGPVRPVPGPPKRFAQAVGAVVTTSTVVLVALGQYALAEILLVLIMLFAALESLFGLCVGCHLFAMLTRAGLIRADVCAACSDVELARVVPSRQGAAG